MLIRKGSRPTVMVNRATKTTKSGDAYLDTAKNGIYEINAWYEDGSCRTTSGDKWQVQKFNGKDADYIVTDPVGKVK